MHSSGLILFVKCNEQVIKENSLRDTGCGFRWIWLLNYMQVCISLSRETLLSQWHLIMDRTGSCRVARLAPTHMLRRWTKVHSLGVWVYLGYGERKWLITFSCRSFIVKLDWIIRFKCVCVHKAVCSNKTPVEPTKPGVNWSQCMASLSRKVVNWDVTIPLGDASTQIKFNF